MIRDIPVRAREAGPCGVILGVLKALRIILTVSGLALAPIGAYAMQESFYYSIEDLNDGMFGYNLLFVYLVELLLLAFTWSPRWAIFGSVAMCGVLGVAEYAVMLFRFVPIQPWDILSIGTAMSVADNYEFVWTDKIKLLVALYIAMLVISLVCIPKPKRPRLGRLPVRLLCTGLCLLSIGGYINLSGNVGFQEKMGYYPYLFTPTVVYKKNGFYFSFTSLMRYLEIEEPEGYDPRTLRNEAEEAVEKERAEGQGTVKDGTVERPNIIVIMNESFSDLDVYGDVDTGDTDVMSFVNSLTENTVKGYAYSSVKGGNTPNSEFEFLTGNTMAFLPMGSIPYQQYMTDDKVTENIFTRLQDMGYKTYGMHPYNASGWRRDEVYPNLGMSECLFLKDFIYPKYVRNYISDKSVYDMIYRLTAENIDNSTPLAFFTVTMQNHGGYTNGDKFANFNRDVEVHNVPEKLSGYVSTYQSLIKLSDGAFESLVDRYEGTGTPTLILMFGDHQPNSSVTDPVLLGLGRDRNPENLTELSIQYKVPFVMWANYDIEEQHDVITSINNLNIYLSEAAGLELSDYQLFRRAVMEEYPVITANFMISSDGKVVPVDSVDSPLIDTYKKLQYSHMFDKDPLNDFFY